MSGPGRERNEIVGVQPEGLSVTISGAVETVHWQEIQSIKAVMAMWEPGSDRRLQVLAITISASSGERIFLVGEVEAIWKPLINALPDALPETQPYVVWTEQLQRCGMLALYERPGSVQ